MPAVTPENEPVLLQAGGEMVTIIASSYNEILPESCSSYDALLTTATSASII